MKILVERSRGLGDVLMTLVVCKGLFQKHNADIFFSTERQYFPIVERFSFIKRVVTEGEARLEDFDMEFHLQDVVDYLPICALAPRLLLLATQCYLDDRFLDFQLRLNPTSYETRKAKQFLKKRRVGKGRFVIGLHLKSFAEIRSWPMEKNLELAYELGQKGYKVIVLENEKERESFKSIKGVLVPKTHSITDLVGLVSQCDMIICPDSGVMHLAAFMDVPFVALFGPIPPEFRISFYQNYRVIYKDGLSCVPCWDWQNWSCGKKYPYKQCMESITVEEVMDAVEELKKEAIILRS